MKILSIKEPSDKSIGIGKGVVFSFENGLSISISSSTDSYATFIVYDKTKKDYTDELYLALTGRKIHPENPSGMNDYHLVRAIRMVSQAKKIAKVIEYEFENNEE